MKLPDFYDEEQDSGIDQINISEEKDGEDPFFYTPGATNERVNNKVSDIISNLDSQQRETEIPKIQSSLYLSDRLNMKPSTVYRNFDAVAKEFWQKQTSPQGAWDSIKRAWEIGWKQYELGKLSYRKMAGEDVGEQIEELKKNMPAEDDKKRAFPASFLKSFANMAPITIGGMREGAREGLATGAAAAGVAAIAGQAGPQAALPEELVTIPGAFLTMFKFGTMKGTMEDINQVEAGLAYDEMTNLGIPHKIAFAASSGVGIVNAALETLQISNIPGAKELLNSSLRRGVRNALRKGTIRTAAGEFAKQYATNIPEQVLQELAQETTNVIATETAKEFTNLSKKEGIERATREEINERMRETAIESAKAFTIMGLPGAVATSVNAASGQRQIQNATDNMQYVDVEDEIWNKLAETEGADLDELVNAINEQTGENQRQEINVEFTTSGAKVKEGNTERNMDFSIDDDAVTITGMDDINPHSARKALAQIQTEYPDRVLQFSEEMENAPKLKRAVEDLDPNARILNFEIDRFDERIESLNEELQTQENEIASQRQELQRLKNDNNTEDQVASTEAQIEMMEEQVEEIRSTIDITENQRQEIIDTKEQYNPLEYRKPWKMTSGEFRRHLQGRAEMAEDVASSAQGMSLKSELVRNFNAEESEAEAGVRLVEAIAAANGEDVQSYMDKTFRFATEQEKASISGTATGKGVAWSGAHQIAEDGRSIIAASESADFSTFVHEMGHVLRRNISAEQENIVAEWAGAVRDSEGQWTWNEAAEENFADGFVEYLQTGQAPDSTLQTIFEKIAEALKEIVYRVFRQVGVTEEVASVFDEFFESGDMPRPTSREDVLYQKSPEADKAFNAVIEERGLTDDIMEAGYVLPEGRMIDLTGRNEAVGYEKDGDYYISQDDDYLAGERVEDHRVVDWEGAPEGGLDRMLKFVELGAMRIDAAAGLVNLAQKPTSAQRNAITEIAEMNGDNVTVEIETPTGEYSFYSEAPPKKLIGTINRYFSTGERPIEQGDVLFQEAPPLELDIEYIKEVSEGKDLSTPENVALHNTKAHIKQTLYDEQVLSDDAIDEINRADEIGDLENTVATEMLEYIGDNRYVEEIYEEQLERAENDITDIDQFTPEGDIFDWAKNAKGVTEDINEAGYILPDGDMLDFSGKREGGSPGVRAQDHRVLGIPLKGELSGSELMTAFQREGAIRVDSNSGLIDLETAPTQEQIGVLRELIEMNDLVMVDLGDGKRHAYFESEAGYNKTIGQIRRFYNGGEITEEILFQPAPPTDSEAFKQWFGDSQVVDEDGSPLVVYHGSEQKFDQFEEQRTAYGYFFTPEKDAAEFYGENLYPVYLKIENPADLRDPPEFYNNLDVDAKESIDLWIEDWFESTDEFIDWLYSGNLYELGIGRAQNEFMRELEADGYDGVIFEDAKGGGGIAPSYVAFEPTQIKSVNNQGTFDPNNPNILFQKNPMQSNEIQEEIDGYISEQQKELEDFRSNPEGIPTMLSFDEKVEMIEDNINIAKSLKNGNIVFENDISYAIVHESTYPGEKWQVSFFDKNNRPQFHDNPKSVTVDNGWYRSVIGTLTESNMQPAPEVLFQKAPPVESESFKNWFSDSKVVNEYGKPQVMYHGSLDTFQVFDKEKIQKRFPYSIGFHFTSRQGEADVYAGVTPLKSFKAEGGSVYPVYLSVQNPLVIKTEETTASMEIDQNRGIIAQQIIDSWDTDNPYDGIIVERNFGDPEWDHKNVVVFEPTQIKSVNNQGTFDPDNPNILFQRSPEHEKEVKNAIDQGFPVPQHVLQEYTDKEWARKEMERRQEIIQKLEDFAWLATEAREFNREDEFVDYVKSEMFEFTAEEEHPQFFEGGGPTEQWTRDFYRNVHEQEFFISDSLEEGNKRWLEQVDRNFVEHFVDELAHKYSGQSGQSVSVHGTFWAAAAKRKHEKRIAEDRWQQMENIIRNNPTRYREIVSWVMDDDVELQKYRIEEAADEARGVRVSDEEIQPRSRLKLANQLKKIRNSEVRDGTITSKEIEDIYVETEKQLRKSEAKIQKLTKELSKEKTDAINKAEGARKVLNRKQDQIKTLEKEIKEKDREIKKLGDKNEKAKERLKKVRDEKNEKLKKLKKEYSTKIREIKKEATAKKNEAVKQERARLKELQKKKKEAQELRNYKKKLGKAITRSVPKNVHWEYREMVEAIQAQIDPNFRTNRTHELWGKRKDFFDRNPEILNEVSPDLAKKLQQQSLDQINLEELESLYNQVEQLIQIGKTKLRLQEQRKKNQAKDAATRIAQTLLRGEKIGPKEPIIDGKKTTGEKAQGLYLSSIRPSRLADMLDRGADFKGFAHQVFIDEVNEAYKTALQQRFNREKVINDTMSRLGISLKDLAEIREIDGVKFSLDQILDIYAASKNQLKWRAVINGNNISPRTALNAIASMSEAETQFAEAIMGDYEDNYHRLRKAHLDQTNEDMGKEANYTPMRRTEGDYTTHKEEIAREIMMKKSLRQGTAWRGMTKSRQIISDKHQRPIRLGLYSTWAEQVPKQEHYIASAEQILKMNRIMRDDYFKEAVEQQIGRPMLEQLQNYTNRFANPSIYKSHNDLDKFVKKVRNNVAIAYLAFNLVTMVKQVPSLAFYMQEASPGDLLAGLWQTTSSWKETREFIEQRDPQMRERAIERDLEELKNLKSTGYQKIQKKISDAGMKGILFFDKIATTSGWISVYNKYKKKGYSEQEAVKAARDTTLRTQPQASAKDVADMYAQDGILTLFTQFSNQLNQIWNMTTYDLPQAMKQHQYYKSLGMFSSIAISGMVIWMLSERRIPDEPEEFAQAMTEQFTNMIPIVGPIVARSMDGWSTEVSVFQPAAGVGELAGLVKDIANGKDVSDYRVESVTRSALEGLAIASGMPYITPRRVVEGIQDDALVQTVLFGGEIGEENED